MTPDWKQWEGDIAGGEFSLDEFLGAGETGAVFRTRMGSGNAAIKLTPGTNSGLTIDQWNRAAALSHPRLIRILKTGTWTKGESTLAFLAMEYAGENLGAVVAERALTAEEVREMLPAVGETLVFLHGRGLAHRGLKAANILAVDDSLKLSSDSIGPGEAAADMRDLGALLRSVFWNQPPAPFDVIARDCSGRVPCSAQDVLDRLRPHLVEPVRREKKTRPTRYALAFGLLLALVVTAGSWWRSRQSDPPAAPVAPAPPVVSVPASTPTPAPTSAPAKAFEKPAPPREARRHRAASAAPGEVIAQALPEIPAPARRTVHGTATVVVRIAVDEAGEVKQARLEPGGSRYFGKFAVEAARKWRFARGAARDCRLRFAITRTETKAYVEPEGAR